jgi:formate hydrogenlyase transcriptional activator
MSLKKDETIATEAWTDLQYRILLEINNAIVTHLDRESLFETLFGTIAENIRKILDFHRCNMTLYDRERDVFRPIALVGPPISSITEIPGKGTAQGRLLEDQQPIIMQDITSSEPGPGNQFLRDAAIKAGLKSGIMVPLVSKGDTIGTLIVTSQSANQYDRADAEFLFAVARQIAMAIQNMTAFEEISRLKAQLEQENVYLQEEIKTQHNFEEIVGNGQAITKTLKAVETVAPTGATVLIQGETGTGKELIARALHNLSPRKDKPLIKVNCAALPGSLIESELFGHEKGAFTGAISRKIGRFELADGGTIFLDEIADLPLELQAKLLRVLQEGEFERVGESTTRVVDVRVIAATNRDLEIAVQQEDFRQDLFYRLNVFPIRLPSLRERKEDIPMLVRHFVVKHGIRLGKKIETLPQKVLDALQTYPWPGNIRELENVIERSVIISTGSELEFGDWTGESKQSAGSTSNTLEDVEREHILKVLSQTGWQISGNAGAAEILGMKRTTLESRMKKLGIRRK